MKTQIKLMILLTACHFTNGGNSWLVFGKASLHAAEHILYWDKDGFEGKVKIKNRWTDEPTLCYWASDIGAICRLNDKVGVLLEVGINMCQQIVPNPSTYNEVGVQYSEIATMKLGASMPIYGSLANLGLRFSWRYIPGGECTQSYDEYEPGRLLIQSASFKLKEMQSCAAGWFAEIMCPIVTINNWSLLISYELYYDFSVSTAKEQASTSKKRECVIYGAKTNPPPQEVSLSLNANHSQYGAKLGVVIAYSF